MDCYECGSEWKEDIDNVLYRIRTIQNGEVKLEEFYCGNCLNMARIYAWEFMPTHMPDKLACEIRVEEVKE